MILMSIPQSIYKVSVCLHDDRNDALKCVSLLLIHLCAFQSIRKLQVPMISLLKNFAPITITLVEWLLMKVLSPCNACCEVFVLYVFTLNVLKSMAAVAIILKKWLILQAPVSQVLVDKLYTACPRVVCTDELCTRLGRVVAHQNVFYFNINTNRACLNPHLSESLCWNGCHHGEAPEFFEKYLYRMSSYCLCCNAWQVFESSR